MVRPVVICGGGGTRLWPLSTPQIPKQFLSITSEKSMLDETLARVTHPFLFSQPRAIGSARHKALLEQSLGADQIVLEPVGRNSAPAITIAALQAEPDEIVLILPADHHIGDVSAFHRAIRRAIAPAKAGQIVTFGIKPDYPATGYGYIETVGSEDPSTDIQKVIRFVEKPSELTAKSHIDTGRFYWNAGIFQFRAEVMIEALRRHAPDILHSVGTALKADGTLDRAEFFACRSESIDYAIMEAADNISVIPVSMGWSDVGDYRAVHALRSNRQGTERIIQGPGVAPQSKRILIHSTGPKVAVHSVDTLAIIATPNSVLISNLDKVSGIKDSMAAIQDHAITQLNVQTRADLSYWLWQDVFPAWAVRAIDPETGGAVESLDLEGMAQIDKPRRGRVASRQLFSYTRAKQMGWNPDGLADRMIEQTYAYITGPARSPKGGWAHAISSTGAIDDASRDLYDHAFIALAGAELAGLGDERGETLAAEAFELIDTLFADPQNGGWADIETHSCGKRANPHMHLLEASLRHYDIMADQTSADRIDQIVTLFERFMFAPESDALLETFEADWSRAAEQRIEPGHCYEWAFLLSEVERLIGRDCASWIRRLYRFAETRGLDNGLVMDAIGVEPKSYRLWPQLERLRMLATLGSDASLTQSVCDTLRKHYLEPGPRPGWVDKLDNQKRPISKAVPASVLYHLVTGLAPFVDGPEQS